MRYGLPRRPEKTRLIPYCGPRPGAACHVPIESGFCGSRGAILRCMIASRRVWLALLLLTACAGGRPGPVLRDAKTFPEADLLILAARVHRLDGKPGGTAVVIRGSRIVAVTTHDGALRYRGGRTRIERLPGGHVFPGIQDAHGHLASLGAKGVDLRGTRSMAELVDRVTAFAARVPAGQWILGRGWDQNLWPGKRMPDHRELSLRVTKHPVLLRRVDGHAALVNARALELAGVDRSTKAPDGGRILRLESGAPSGVFVDRAMQLVARHVSRGSGLPGPAMAAQLLAAQKACLRVGITRVHDAGVSAAARRAMRELERDGRWKLGVYGMLPAPSSADALPALEDPDPRARIRFRAVKLYADGALGSRGAALLEDYTDEKGNRGLLTTPVQVLRAQVDWCRARGYQPCIHAIGDRANRIVLDAYEQILSAAERTALRPRIEHAQVLAAVDAPRLARLGVLASMQPTHLTTDMPWAPARLGPDRVRGAYAFKTLLEGGTHLCFGSDFPVEPENPFEGVFAAITTRPPSDPGHAPLRPDQALSRVQALRAFTTGAAFAAFEESVRGRISPGFEADLTVVDRDLLDPDVPAEAILATKVLVTVVGGEVVYRLGER